MSLPWHIGFTLVKAENGLSTSHTFIIEKIHRKTAQAATFTTVQKHGGLD